MTRPTIRIIAVATCALLAAPVAVVASQGNVGAPRLENDIDTVLYTDFEDSLEPWQPRGDAAPTTIEDDIPSLRDALDVPVGVAIDGRETTGAAADLVLKHFDRITPENHMKPVEIQPTEGEFTFDNADELMRFAADNDLTVYGHTLVWHSQIADWFFEDPETGEPLTDDPDDQELLRERLRTHIFTFADHFRDEFGEYGEDNPLVAIDVVNEAIAESEHDGLRRTEWYRILGAEYLVLAFEYAREAFGPEVALVINDYNTELPAKRAALFDVVADLLDAGAPVDAVGHQLHLSLLQDIAQIGTTIELFTQLDVAQYVTELDVTVNTGGESWTTPPDAVLVDQGYYFRDLFGLLTDHTDVLEGITVWGPTDARSWRSEGFPLLFDGDLQAKPAFWGIVDPEQLPPIVRAIHAHATDHVVDLGDVADAVLDEAAAEWTWLPGTTIGASATAFQLRWSRDGLVAHVAVADDTDDAGDDIVELFVATPDVHDNAGHDDNAGHADNARHADNAGVLVVTADRAGGSAGDGLGGVAVTSSDDGYVVVAAVPIGGLAEGDVLGIDVRVTDGATGARLSWNDTDHAQEDGARLGALTLVEPLRHVEIPRGDEVPEIDGVIDAVWADAPVVHTDVQVEGEPGATAEIRLLWHGLESAASVTDDGYVVEVAIDLAYEPQPGQLIGLELQVNDATDGVRTSVRTWSDPTGRSYQSPTRWGVATLVA